MTATILFTALFLHYITTSSTQLTFLYSSPINKIHYKYQQEDVIKLTFLQSQLMIDSKDKLVNHTVDLMKPYSLTADTIKTLIKENNQIAIQMSSFITWVGKFKSIYEEFEAMANFLNDIPDIKYTRNVTITVDSLYLEQQFLNIDNYAKKIVQLFKDKADLNSLILDKDSLKTAVELFEFLITDTESYIDSYYTFANSFRLSLQQFLTKQVRLALLDKESIIDQININFLSNGIEDSSPVFFLKVLVKKNPFTYCDYIPIPYNQFSLSNGFHYNYNTSTIDKFFTTEEIQMGQISQIKDCLKHLNNNDIINIIKYCHFQKNHLNFHQTNTGVLFFNGTNSLVLEIEKKFKKDIKNKFPFYIQFNNSIEFNDNKYGKIHLIKDSQFKIQYSSLTSQQVQILYNTTHFNNTIINTNDSVISDTLNYFSYYYYEIIVNFTIISLFLSIIVVINKYKSKLNCRKTTNSRTPIQKVINKRLKANPKYNY